MTVPPLKPTQFFVTGTGTEIGKTVAASWLCLKLKAGYWKPIQSGTLPATDSQRVNQLTENTIPIFPSTYSFETPVSPHLAAAVEGKEIKMQALELPTSSPLIVEGAGGVLVPLTHKHFLIDLIAQLNLPTLVVASTILGTINHTLLTLEALRKRSIPITGVILTGPENPDNGWAIETYGQVPIIGHLPFLSPLTRDALEQIPFREKL